ncbi:hypothetical protein V8G54_019668 [Vigna mungo]|uniref:Uncharacterized protein n=1 Tax=Vigna mungo TaxID=3915 RepID=A0AAQ3NC22_VIGMU
MFPTKALNSPLKPSSNPPSSRSSNKSVSTSTDSFTQLANSLGTLPVSEFLETSRTLSSTIWPISEGILPSKMFPSTKRVLKFLHLPIWDGISPVKKLRDNFKCFNESQVPFRGITPEN